MDNKIDEFIMANKDTKQFKITNEFKIIMNKKCESIKYLLILIINITNIVKY